MYAVVGEEQAGEADKGGAAGIKEDGRMEVEWKKHYPTL